jgi:hypothetical protein
MTRSEILPFKECSCKNGCPNDGTGRHGKPVVQKDG